MLRHFVYHLHRLAIPAALAVRFEAGAARAERGKVRAALLADCADVAATFAIRRGRVEAVRGWRGLSLRFSPGIPKASHQRFRNVFGVHLVGQR